MEKCPFCNSLLEVSEFNLPGLCTNKTCPSFTFVLRNRVRHRFNPDLGIGEIIEVKYYSKQLTGITTRHSSIVDFNTHKKGADQVYFKYIVDFEAKSTQIVYPREIIHHVWFIGDRVRFNSKFDLDRINKSNKTDKNKDRKANMSIGIIQNRRLHEPDNILRYQVQLSTGKTIWIEEFRIRENVLDPISEFLYHRVSADIPFLIHIWAVQILDLYSSNYLKIVTNSRLSLLPHQVSVAHHLLQQNESRMILADEVGLGKTIEAGIYIKEMLARKLARRILIIAPASLCSQWEFEMENKFSLNFTRLDSARLKNTQVNFSSGNFQDMKSGEEYTLCTVSLQFARLPQCSLKLLQIEWDIVVFDEAHHLRRYLVNAKTDLYRTTLAYDLAEQLSSKTHNLLLLTATPIQLHAFDLYSLICLLDPYRFPNFESFESERKNLIMLNLIIKQLLNFSRISAFERRSLTYNILNFLPNYQIEDLDSKLSQESFRVELIKILERKHFLSDYVIRNRRKRVFPNHKIRRIPKIIDVILTPEELSIYNKIHLYLAKIYSRNFEGGTAGTGFIMIILQKLLTSSVPAITKSLQRRIRYLEENEEMLTKFQTEIQIHQEFQDDEAELDLDLGVEEFELEDRMIYYKRKRLMKPKKENELNIKDHIKILKEFVQDLKSLKIDSKAERLQEIIHDILSKNPNEKIIIFTQFKATLFYLSSIFEKKSIMVAHFHGDLNEKQKNQEVYKFKTTHSILLSTEIGGEGRNFQFCHIIINYDLPWNPMRLEQRIGRLDRIGQTKDIWIYNFYIADTVESSIVNAIIDRIHLFEESIGSLEPILGGLEKQITDLVLREDEIPYKFRLEEVITKTADKIEEVYAKLDDFVLDQKSFQTSSMMKNLQNDKILNSEDIFQFLKKIQDFTHQANYNNQNIMRSLLTQFSNGLVLEKTLSKNKIEFWKIIINEQFRSHIRASSRHYEGTFSMEIAQKYEEIDFFALGHELIMKTAEFCARDDFSGFTSYLQIDSSRLIKWIRQSKFSLTTSEKLELQRILKENEILYLFYIELKTIGILIEKIIYPIIISSSGLIFHSLIPIFYHPAKFSQIFIPLEKNNQMYQFKSIINESKIRELYQQALNGLKQEATPRIEYLIQENRKRYSREKKKLLATAEMKKKYIMFHLDKLKTTLRVKKVKLPTERQLQNLKNIVEMKKRAHKERQIDKLHHEIEYLENEIKYWLEKLEEMEFDIPAKLKRLKQHKILQINADLVGFAVINL